MAILSTAAQKDVEILKLKEKVKITATGRCTFRSTPEDDLVNVTVKFSIPIKKLKVSTAKD